MQKRVSSAQAERRLLLGARIMLIGGVLAAFYLGAWVLLAGVGIAPELARGVMRAAFAADLMALAVASGGLLALEGRRNHLAFLVLPASLLAILALIAF